MGDSIKQIANNKKAFHDFFVEESLECGIQLFGTEVKSLRLGQASIKESFCQIRNGECFIVGMHINPYERGNIFNKDPLRDRKLLLHRREIDRLLGKIKEQGYTLMPLRLYFKGSLVKLDMGLCRGKKIHSCVKALSLGSDATVLSRKLRCRLFSASAGVSKRFTPECNRRIYSKTVLIFMNRGNLTGSDCPLLQCLQNREYAIPYILFAMI